MTFSSLAAFVASAFSLGLALFVLLRDRRFFSHRVLILGMTALALEALFTGLSLLDIPNREAVRWQRLRYQVTALIPGLWLLFALTYARINYRAFVKKYAWAILVVFAAPLVLVSGFWGAFLQGRPIQPEGALLRLTLGWAGYYFHLCCILSTVLILMNLEKTLRGSIGHMRWQVKFMAMGVGGLFAVRLYTDAETILFLHSSLELHLVNSVALLVAGALILKSLLRARLFSVDFYVSQSFLFNSITLFLAGIYLLFVGLVAKAVNYFGGRIPLSLYVSLVFLSVLGVSALFLSDRVRRRLKRFISLHLRRPFYDYRKEWTEFTQATTSVADVRSMCTAVASKISTTFQALAVTIWLIDEKGENLIFGGSTTFTESQAQKIVESKAFTTELIALMRRRLEPVDLFRMSSDLAEAIKEKGPEDLKEFKTLYSIPLRAGTTFLGFVILDGRVEGVPLSVEDYDLLRTIGDQTAGILMNFRLAENLRRLKETEAYQTMSAFMMHDLKNLASNLSLTMQNLPVHFDNPDFRQDALHMIQQSVAKLNKMCKSLSMLSQKVELKQVETDINELVKTSLECLNGHREQSLAEDLHPVPSLFVDPEQVQKVLTNLLLNANEAAGRDSGIIRVGTEHRGGWVIISVTDNGAGMSQEFIEKFLFRPFKTTKKQGMGIGLYQSKTIIEAHGGRIEVESDEGRGTTFKVWLPTEAG
jgi:putative PEP-CTERM system histidine kinase